MPDSSDPPTLTPWPGTPTTPPVWATRSANARSPISTTPSPTGYLDVAEFEERSERVYTVRRKGVWDAPASLLLTGTMGMIDLHLGGASRPRDHGAAAGVHANRQYPRRARPRGADHGSGTQRVVESKGQGRGADAARRSDRRDHRVDVGDVGADHCAGRSTDPRRSWPPPGGAMPWCSLSGRRHYVRLASVRY